MSRQSGVCTCMCVLGRGAWEAGILLRSASRCETVKDWAWRIQSKGEANWCDFFVRRCAKTCWHIKDGGVSLSLRFGETKTNSDGWEKDLRREG